MNLERMGIEDGTFKIGSIIAEFSVPCWQAAVASM